MKKDETIKDVYVKEVFVIYFCCASAFCLRSVIGCCECYIA